MESKRTKGEASKRGEREKEERARPDVIIEPSGDQLLFIKYFSKLCCYSDKDKEKGRRDRGEGEGEGEGEGDAQRQGVKVGKMKEGAEEVM